LICVIENYQTKPAMLKATKSAHKAT